MLSGDPEGGAMLVAERRRRICDWLRRHGSANVGQLAAALGVGANTIRRDLAALAGEGRLVRSHGGAVANEPGLIRLPYAQVCHENLEQKGWIADVALCRLPSAGSVFLGDGVTVQALAQRIPADSCVHVVTNSVRIAARLVSDTSVSVELLGGRVRPELLATDCSLAAEAIEMLFWDVAFVGAAALDAACGITERDAPEATRQRRLIDRAARVIALCDSSKIGRCSYARVGPLDLIDTIITDTGASPEDTAAMRDLGIEVLLAGPAPAAVSPIANTPRSAT